MKQFEALRWISFLGLNLVFTLPLTAMGGQSSQRTLVWAEEFDYEGFPDPQKWVYEKGFVRNRELQYYTQYRQR